MDSNNMYQNPQSGGPEPDNGGNMNYGGGNFSQNDQSVNYGNNPYQDNNMYTQNTYTNPNQNYQPYQFNNNSYPQSQMDMEEPVSMGEWLLSMLIMLIPCVNIIMMFVWAFGSGVKKSKSNFFKASLIFTAIVVVLEFVVVFYLISAGAAIGSRYFYY